MNINQFIQEHQEHIVSQIKEMYPPTYVPDPNETMPKCLRPPIRAQKQTISGVAFSLKENKGTILVGEMGTGKTFISIMAAKQAGFKRILVMCPPHLVEKWKREIEQTLPVVTAVIVKSISDLKRIPATNRTLFIVVSRERAKLSFRWMPVYDLKIQREDGKILRDPETHAPFRAAHCIDCNAPQIDKEGLPRLPKYFESRRRYCSNCKSPMWSADKKGPRRYALSEYIKRHMKGFFQLFIGDEIHEYKGKGSAQGISAGQLAEACGKSLSLTGTLMGGYSSTLFYLLYRFSPQIRDDFEYNDETKWIKKYGFVEEVVKEETKADNRYSRGKKTNKRTREMPGILPTALFHLLPNTAFIRLPDIAPDLPKYTEIVDTMKMDDALVPAYAELYRELYDLVSDGYASGSMKYLSTFLQSLLVYPDRCTKENPVYDPDTGKVIFEPMILSESHIYNKEKRLIELVKEEKRLGRKVLVYATHTDTKDITPRLQMLLREHGIRAAIMKASKPSPQHRESWIKRTSGRRNRRSHLPS